MRELKFRAWSPERNGFVKNCYPIGYAMKDGFQLNGVGEGDGCQDTEDDGLILMQYTGLKDKNGKEIYEGDILGGNKFPYQYAVKYENGCFACYHFKEKYLGKWGNLSRIFDADMNEIFNDIEIIGNIYENEDLLK